MNQQSQKFSAICSHSRFQSRRGLTLIELIAAIAIASIVGAMTLVMFIFPQRIVNKGENISDIQFDLRMISLTITDTSRLALDIEILPSGSLIPDTVDTDSSEIYLFVRSSDGAFIRRDNTGDRTIVKVSDLEILFEAPDSRKILSYSISGTSSDESFSLSSQVFPLNLSLNEITDSSGVNDGTIIRIENITEIPTVIPDVTSLYFKFYETLNNGVGSSYEAYFEAINADPNGSLNYTLQGPNPMPPGLTLSDDGRISGIPIEANQYPISVHLTDGTQSASLPFVITIADDGNGGEEEIVMISTVQLSGTFEVGYTVSGSYSLIADPPMLEGNSTVSWYTKLTPSSPTAVRIAGPDSVKADEPFTYTMKSEDAGQYLYFEVTPVAVDENGEGINGATAVSETHLVESNSPPSVTSTKISPASDVRVGKTIKVSYTYSDEDGDLMDRVQYIWYRSNIDNPNLQIYSEEVAAPLANDYDLSFEYTVTAADAGMFLSLELIPYATTGELIGEPVRTVYVNVKNN